MSKYIAEPHTSPRKYLNRTADRATLQKLLQVGHEFDLDKGGCFDAAMAIVNIWCSPTDKPSCWNKKILGGKYEMAYVGALTWDIDSDADPKQLYLEATPYEFLDERWSYRWDKISEEDYDSIFAWLEEKANFLLRMADLQATVTGTKCPLCDFVLPNGRLLNELFEHMTAHGDVDNIVIGDPFTVTVDGKTLAIESATEFDK